MRAVFRHELSSYFTGVTGYVFSAFLLLFSGIYTMVYNLQSASVHFEYVLGSMSFVFLIIVPILTMRVLAEERRQSGLLPECAGIPVSGGAEQSVHPRKIPEQ